MIPITHQITETQTELFIIPIAESKPFHMNIAHQSFWYRYRDENNTIQFHAKELPDGKDWTPIGLLSELTEEKLLKVMPHDIERHYDYLKGGYHLRTALESLQSLMQFLQVYTKNPFNPPIERLQYGGGYAMRQSEIDEYEQAQQRTHSDYAILIIKID